MYGNSGEWLGIVNLISDGQAYTKEECPRWSRRLSLLALPFDHPVYDKQCYCQGDKECACCSPSLRPQFASVLFADPDHGLSTPARFKAERFAASGRKVASDRFDFGVRFEKFAILVGYRRSRAVARKWRCYFHLGLIAFAIRSVMRPLARPTGIEPVFPP
jgi:hypothetical protein